jgi:hypothetical protein
MPFAVTPLSAIALGLAAPAAVYALTPKSPDDAIFGPYFDKNVNTVAVGAAGALLLLGYALGRDSTPAYLAAGSLLVSAFVVNQYSRSRDADGRAERERKRAAALKAVSVVQPLLARWQGR